MLLVKCMLHIPCRLGLEHFELWGHTDSDRRGKILGSLNISLVHLYCFDGHDDELEWVRYGRNQTLISLAQNFALTL